MSQNLTKKFEKESPLSDSEHSGEKLDIGVEKGESAVERSPEKESRSVEKSGEAAKPVSKKSKLSISTPDAERQKQIDQILSEGLDDVFLSLSQDDQVRFKEEGEKTALKINELLSKTKVKIKNIISLIKKWLKIIPKVNPYFLEQEAKIKADKIVKLKK